MQLDLHFSIGNDSLSLMMASHSVSNFWLCAGASNVLVLGGGELARSQGSPPCVEGTWAYV
eukprot:COSAG02_NODE_1520_length_12166_cov_8.338195_6_plen_61_part_00